MATNRERVERALDLLRAGLGPFVDGAVADRRFSPASWRRFVDDPRNRDRPVTEWDVQALLKLMWEAWNDVFRNILGPAERGFVGELRGHRNRWAHQESFSSDDAYRAIDTAHRLLTAVSAEQARDAERLKMEVLNARFEEQTQDERRRHAGSTSRYGGGSLGPRREPAPHGVPEYRCPIPGCTKVFRGTRGGWDAHVASWRMHPNWHPDITDGEERKRRFRREYPRW